MASGTVRYSCTNAWGVPTGRSRTVQITSAVGIFAVPSDGIIVGGPIGGPLLAATPTIKPIS